MIEEDGDVDGQTRFSWRGSESLESEHSGCEVAALPNKKRETAAVR